MKLKHVPKTIPTEVFALNDDSSLGTKYDVAETASKTACVIGSDGTVTAPSDMTSGRLFVMYEYEVTGDSVAIVNESNNFPKAVKLIVECLCYDPCDSDTKILCYIKANNALMSSDFDVTMAASETHPFTYQLQQDYCDADKRLYEVIVVED